MVPHPPFLYFSEEVPSDKKWTNEGKKCGEDAWHGLPPICSFLSCSVDSITVLLIVDENSGSHCI